MLNAVEISNLTVKYPDVKALDDVSFVVKEGDFLGIIGPNGAGKSTLFDSMLGLNTTYTGTIKFFEQDIKNQKNIINKLDMFLKNLYLKKIFLQQLVILLGWD